MSVKEDIDRSGLADQYTKELGTYQFSVEEFFPARIMTSITNVRINFPHVIACTAAARKKRLDIAPDGKLTILACDHPGRYVTKSGDDELAMANRQEYLGRILRVIMSEDFDGVMGTTDILEDLFIVDYLVQKAGGPSFLDGKVMLGCMNRGGLSGAVWEMDDMMTSYTTDEIIRQRLDGAKIMVRLEPTVTDSARTLKYCADIISELVAKGVPAFIEPLPVRKEGGKFSIVSEAGPLARIAGVASALGRSSALTWLKLPYCDNYEIVAKATTCPILMLGGAAKGSPIYTMAEFERGMKAGTNIRGALVGRNIHMVVNDDPAPVAGAIHKVIHDGFDVKQALGYIAGNRGDNLDALTEYL